MKRHKNTRGLGVTSGEQRVIEKAATDLHRLVVRHLLAIKKRTLIHEEYKLAGKEVDAAYNARDRAQTHYNKVLDSIADDRFAAYMRQRKAQERRLAEERKKKARLSSHSRAITLRKEEYASAG